MSSLAIWMISLAVGLAIIVLSGAVGDVTIHTVAAALISLSMAAMAVTENRQQRKAGASENVVAASTARYMGLVWVWGALSLFTTYYFILSWKEWLVFTGAFAVIGALCLFFAATLDRDEAAGRTDETLQKLAKYLSIGQLFGMVIVMLGLIIDGKFPVTAEGNPGWQDWAANNIFFFGALSVALITANALYTKHQREKAGTQNA